MELFQFSTTSTVILPLSQLENNTGQIAGLPPNPRKIDTDKLIKLKQSITDNPEYLQTNPLKVIASAADRYVIIGGNMRLLALQALGYTNVPCAILSPDTPPEKLRAYTIIDNSSFGQWDWDSLTANWDLSTIEQLGIDIPDDIRQALQDDSGNDKAVEEAENERQEKALTSLTEDFFYPPMSLIDTTRGVWLERRRKWYDLGIKSEKGREQTLTFGASAQPMAYYDIKNDLRRTLGREPTSEEVTQACREKGVYLCGGTSIFDPVLTEIIYRWFNLPHGSILDPFAGGSVRGIVASYLQMPYHGNDLRREQIEENRTQLNDIPTLLSSQYTPQWTIGDSAHITDLCTEEERQHKFDLIFSCPPYADLEKYSDDPADISNMAYPQFLTTYRDVIRQSCALLNDNRFAVFVVGDIRDNRGFYRDFIGDTIRAFEDAGLHYYNQMIIVNQISSLATRVRRPFLTRKIGKRHQNVIVAYKGTDPADIVQQYEKQNIEQCIANFDTIRAPFQLHDYALCFIKGDPKAAAAEFPPQAVTDGFIPMPEHKPIFSKFKDKAEPLCNLQEKIQTFKLKNTTYTTFYRKSKEGIPLSEIKTPQYVEQFAAAALRIIREQFGIKRFNGYALAYPPKRRHTQWNFAEAVCLSIAAATGITLYKDLFTAKTKERINPTFTINEMVKEDNVIIFDDIVTTGSTIKAINSLLSDKNARYICAIKNA